MNLNISQEEFETALDKALEYFPGITLKQAQKSCLESLVVYNQDVLGVLPTGYGKSLIYQVLPKLYSSFWQEKYLENRTFQIIVISPLELIRKQQVSKLNDLGIKSIALESCESGSDAKDIEIIFGSAEQWLSERWKREIKSGSLKEASVLVVDEAHTVEMWGKGKKGKAAFRQAFGQVKDLRSFLGNKPLLALTATADINMRKRLCSHLALKNSKEIIISPNNENIRYSVLEADQNLTCFDWLVEIVKSKKHESPFTIIFCHTVSDIVFIFSTMLMKLGKDAYIDGTLPAPQRCLVGIYYSASPESLKSRVCESFEGKQGNVRVAIASTSLSMGVDYPHVRYVVHFGPGRSITEHLQQAGRAGRDTMNAYNIIIYQGKHLSHCDPPVRLVVKTNDCIRKLLLNHFVEEEIKAVQPLHNCCSRCHMLCKCGPDHEECVVPMHKFDKLETDKTPPDAGRIVTEEDKECLREALREVQVTINLQSGLTLFDNSGIITHGFSDSVIDSLVSNCSRIFTVADLMEIGFVSSLKLAIVVLEVFNEIFEDVDISDDFHELALMSSLIYTDAVHST